MDLITFRCTSCSQGLKVPGVNAGRKVKCTKCGTSLTVPNTSESAAAASAKPATKKPIDDDDDGSAGIYGLEGAAPVAPAPPAKADGRKNEESKRGAPGRKKRGDDDDDEDDDDDDEFDEEAREEADEELRRRLAGEDEDDRDDDEYDDEDRPKKKRGPRAKLDSAAFQKVRIGLLLAVIAISLLGLSLLLHKIFILIGLTASQRYAETLHSVHPHYADSDNTKDVDLMRLVVALVGGAKSYDANKALLIIGQVLVLLQEIVTIAACAMCLTVPKRFGARGLAMTALVIASVNLIVALVFKFLPVVGAIKLVLVPLFGAELAMSNANLERLTPLHLLWSGSPYVQVFLTVLILALSYGELFLFPLFMRAVAIQLKSEKLENSCLSLVQLSLAQVFIQLAFQLMAMTGSSDVLSIVLKVFYILGLAFFVWQLAWYILILLKARKIIQDALDREEAILSEQAT